MAYSSLLIILFAVVARASNHIYSKYALTRIDSISLYLVTNIVCALAVFPFIIKDLPSFFSMPTVFMLAVVGAGIFQPVTGILSNYALQKTPVGIYTTINQLQLVWVILGSTLLLSERITWNAGIGISMIILASLLVSDIDTRKTVGMKVILLVVASSFAAAVAIMIDRLLIVHTSSLLYFFFMITIPTLLFVPHIMKKRNDYAIKIKKHWIVGLVASVCFGATYYGLLLLYTLPDVPLSISYSIRNTSNIFAVALAIFIFGENKNVPRKLLAVVIAVIGAAFTQFA